MNIHTRTIGILLPLSCILFGFSGCSHAESTRKNAASGITHRAITLAVVGDYPPYDIYKDGEASGIATDMMKEVFARLHLPIHIQQLPFKRALVDIQRGTIDGISGLGKNAEREQYILYPATPLATTTVTFFVRKDSNIVYHGDLREMGQYTIGTAFGFMYSKEFKALVDQGILHTDESKTVESNIQKLIGKRFDVFIANSGVARNVAKQLGVSSYLQELSPPIDTGHMYLGISKQSPLASYVDKINGALLSIRIDGTETRILARYTQ